MNCTLYVPGDKSLHSRVLLLYCNVILVQSACENSTTVPGANSFLQEIGQTLLYMPIYGVSTDKNRVTVTRFVSAGKVGNNANDKYIVLL
jgi:hypothetical protein